MKNQINYRSDNIDLTATDQYYGENEQNEQVTAKQPTNNKYQVFQTTINLISRTLGASVLSGAYIYRFMGIVPSLLLIIITITILLTTNQIIINKIHQHKSKTFRELVKQIAGIKVAQILDIIVIILAFGSLTNYVIIISRAIQPLIQPYTSLSVDQIKFIVKTCVPLLLIFPLTLLKNTKQLAKISPYSVICISATIVTIISYFIYSYTNHSSICQIQVDQQNITLINNYDAFSNRPVWSQIINFGKYMPTMLYIFSLLFALPIVYTEHVKYYDLPDQQYNTFTRCVRYALFISIFMYSLISFSVSIMFGELTKDNVFDSFKLCKFKLMDFISLTYAVVLILCYSLQLQPARLGFVQLIKKEDNYKFYILIGLLYIVVTTSIALFCEMLVAIFGLFSSFCGFFLYFLIPILAANIQQKYKYIIIAVAFSICATAFITNFLDFF